MKAIYEPKGRALEYAPLACNLYTGCRHGCRYCYAPRVLRRDRAEFGRDVRPRAGILQALSRDCARARAGAYGEDKRVLLCFTCDPYQKGVEDVTGDALQMLGEAGMIPVILTKNPKLALRWDADYLFKYRAEFGVTISLTSESDREKWEPGAVPIEERFEALRAAKALGLYTWVSVEPVIYPEQALEVIRKSAEIGVDAIKVGKLNYDAGMEAQVDWWLFAKHVRTFRDASVRPVITLKADLENYPSHK